MSSRNALIKVNILITNDHRKMIHNLTARYKMKGNSSSELIRKLIEFETSTHAAEQFIIDSSCKVSSAPRSKKSPK